MDASQKLVASSLKKRAWTIRGVELGIIEMATLIQKPAKVEVPDEQQGGRLQRA